MARPDEAEFDLDLDDFTKRFDNVCHTKEPLRPLGS